MEDRDPEGVSSTQRKRDRHPELKEDQSAPEKEPKEKKLVP